MTERSSSIFFRLSVDTVDQAAALESRLVQLGADDIDVDPSGSGLLDPLTLTAPSCIFVAARLPIDRLGGFLAEFWATQAMPGLVIDCREPVVTVMESAIITTARIVVIAANRQQVVHAGLDGTDFAKWIADGRQLVSQPPIGDVAAMDIEDAAAASRDARIRAESHGLNPDTAEANGLRAAWIEKLWSALIASLDEDTTFAVERARSSRVRYVTLPSMAAMTVWGGRATVRIHLGMFEAMIECARTLLGEWDAPDDRGPVEASSGYEEAGLRLAHVLGWMTSFAGCPVSTPSHRLSDRGEQMARTIATATLLFVLAHELGHVIGDDSADVGDRDTAHAREFHADVRALAIIRRFLALGSPATAAATEMTGFDLSPEMVVAGAALFLAFEGLRLQVTAGARGARLGLDLFDRVATTETESHPSPFARLAALQREAELVDADGSEASIMRGVADGFDAYLPIIERNMPEWKLDLADAQTAVAAVGLNSVLAQHLVGKTLQEVTSDGLIELLRDAATNGLSESHLVQLTEFAAHNPRPTIDTLALARVGRLPAKGDPDAERIHAVAVEVAARIEPQMLRYAVNAEPNRITLLAGANV